MPCPACGCNAPDGERAHLLQGALGMDDLDRAIDIGLLEESVHCRACSDACREALVQARQARRQALAARERFRSRNARLARRERERAERRRTAGTTAPGGAGKAPSLPPAAAAALARAKARAASGKKT